MQIVINGIFMATIARNNKSKKQLIKKARRFGGESVGPGPLGVKHLRKKSLPSEADTWGMLAADNLSIGQDGDFSSFLLLFFKTISNSSPGDLSARK